MNNQCTYEVKVILFMYNTFEKYKYKGMVKSVRQLNITYGKNNKVKTVS